MHTHMDSMAIHPYAMDCDQLNDAESYFESLNLTKLQLK